MNRNHFWKLVLILFLLAWAIFEINPPTARPLVEYFRTRAVNQDATFKSIITQAQELEKARPQLSYANLQEAIGTNDLNRYFPFFEAKNEARPTTYILNRLQREAAGKVKLGIDLAGGTSFLVEMDTNQLQNAQTAGTALSQAVEVLRKRVDKFGVAEPVIQPEGNDRILIQLPGLSEEQTANARETIQKVAFLEFRLVHPDSRALLEQGTTIVPGYELMTHSRTDQKGQKLPPERYLVKKRAEMTGGIKSALVTRDQLGRPEISFTLESKAAEKFGQITSDNVGHQLAIILDGELQTAPNIKSAITGGSGVIEGDYSEPEAFALANVLENPLQAPVHIINELKIDPTLGKDSITSGIKAALYGVIAVAVFMLVYYLLAGLVANVALMLNIIILLGVMCSIGTTLTLPGIAGIVLTIGMAVDANVLIFERIREELALGKSLRGALNAGYGKAFGTIFDSNLTTLISSVILIFMGTGPVKGFGVTLTIGVTVSMFTALVATRLIFDWLLAKNILKRIPMLHIIKSANVDFMRWAVPAFAISWLIILIGNGYGIFGRGHDVLSVEFSGGETMTMSFDQQHKVEVDKVRAAARKVSAGDLLVAYQRDLSSGMDTLRVTVRSFADGKSAQGEPTTTLVAKELNTSFPEAKFKVMSTDRVGPTVGQEIQKTAVLASLLALFGILIYVAFRYEFSFAVGAVVAILHDILMTLGLYFLSGKELNATTVAAVLTIIGFSINDTIVIFDRIREDLKLGVRGTFREVINKAINQTLSRTIITSGTVFLATVSLYIFGGGVINDFAFTFLAGIITGTYSSIYIASAIVLWWHKGHRPNIGNAQMSVEAAATAQK
ncbi:MAG: protein translocase subunit SecD [Verrucomicrobiota bacterium]